MSSGLDGIVNSILAEAKEESAKILSDAKRKCEAILADAKLCAEKIRENSLVSVSRMVEVLTCKENSLAEMKYRDGVLKAKLGIVGDVISSAKEFLYNLSSESYFSVLLGVCSKCFHSGASCSLVLPQEDYDRMTSGCKEMFIGEARKEGVNLNICVDDGVKRFKGAILKYGNYEENCTLDEVFNQNREVMLVFLLEFLFKESASCVSE